MKRGEERGVGCWEPRGLEDKERGSQRVRKKQPEGGGKLGGTGVLGRTQGLLI